MAVVDTDMVQKKRELNLEISSCIKSMSSKKKLRFQCEFWDKVSLSSYGLKRYITKKQPFSKAQETSFSFCFVWDLSPKAKVKLQPQILKGFFEKIICNLAQDECYPKCYPASRAQRVRESCEE